MSSRLTAILTLPLSLCLACGAAAETAEGLVPAVTVKEIMVGAIEPASNALWALALEENEPKTEAEWRAVEHAAIQLLAATAATSLGGAGAGDRALAQNEQWREYSRDMAAITRDVLSAARERDYYATIDTANLLIEPCGACHSAFPVDSQID